MRIKEALKNNKKILEIYSVFLKFLTKISSTLNTKVAYFISKGRPINLDEPDTIQEKLSWLKLYSYSKDPLVIKCADKFAVREYIEEKGYGNLLNELLNVYSNVEEIKEKDLPNKFALKWTTGAGGNYIHHGKEKIDLAIIRKELNNWKKVWDKQKPYMASSEMHYSHIEPKIILEKYLGNNEGSMPIDYKIYCFNGEPKAILVMSDRETDIKGTFMSPDWEFISHVSKYEKMKNIPQKPKSLEKMVKAAFDLSKPFPFVRIDFYDYRGYPIFGEMTFTPAGGLSLATTDIDGRPMGDHLDISINIREWQNSK